MKTLKKTLAIILTILMTVTSLPMATGLTSFAAEDDRPIIMPEETELSPVVPEEYFLTGITNVDENGEPIWQIEQEKGDGGIIITKWINVFGDDVKDPDKPDAYPDTDDNGEPIAWGENLPETYDGRELGIITPVEYQIGGTCWAHAAIACLETSYIKQGFGDTIDLSEYHTVWFSKNGYIEGETNGANDGYVTDPETAFDEGGNTNYVARALSNFAGAALEEDLVLDSTKQTDLIAEIQQKFTFDKKYKYEAPMGSIKNVDYEIDQVKQAVIDYGAVFILYNSKDAYYSLDSTWYVGDSQPLAYYCPEDLGTNHAVTVVGWDDNFSKTNFREGAQPENDGAWLIKNSWSERWGNNGYFWMSYEDKSISSGCDVLTVSDPSEYQDVYLYDGAGYGTSKNGKAGANVYTAHEDIYLSQVRTGSSYSLDYIMSIYKNIPENCTDPTAGDLIYTQSGNTNGEAISVYGDVKLAKGERFSVVLEMKTLYYEGNSTDYRRITSNPGESFFMDNDGVWHDTSTYNTSTTSTSYLNNSCIRVIAKYQDADGKYKVTFKDGKYHSEYAYSENGTVVLPEKEGHTYVFTYDGEEFTGTSLTQDVVVETHCYITQGEISDYNECTTVYNCIYCGQQVKEPDVNHDYKTTVVPANSSTIGYTIQKCSVCGDYNYSDYTLLNGAAGGQTDGYWWQYSNGTLCVAVNGALPDYESDSVLPWNEYKSQITTVKVFDKVTRIGSYIFKDLSAMNEIVVPETVESLGVGCFYNSTSLAEFECPENLLSIEKDVFYKSGIAEIDFNDKLTSLAGYAFQYCNNLEEVYIPGSADTGDFPFYNCSALKKIAVGEGSTYITNLAWYCFNVEEIVIPASARDGFFSNFLSVEKYTVAQDNKYLCSVDGVLYDKDVTTIIAYPATKKDPYFKIPETIDTIDYYVFSRANGLKYLDMSACQATIIKDYAFSNTNSKLQYINLPANLVNLWSYSFSNSNVKQLFVPSTVTSYQNPPFSGGVKTKIYTDSDTAKIKEFADANGYECVTTHTTHDFSTLAETITDACTATKIMTCECGQFIAETTDSHIAKDGSAVVTAPTCTEGGYTTYICELCGESYVGNLTQATDHSYQWIIDKAATCVESGIKHEECSVCNVKRNENTAIEATGIHSYTKVVTAPTCTTAGYTTYTCSCGDTYTADETPMTAHAYGEWEETKAATCTTKGEETRVCADCKVSETREIATIAHSYTSVVTKPTCTTTGYTTYTCSCGDTYTADETPAKGHAYGEWEETKAPTCSVKGEETRVCADCKVSETREVATIAHSYTSVVTKPTCTTAGYTTYTCSCGDTYTADEVAATGHSYGEWSQTKAPTCTVKGGETRVCADCKASETREIATIAHSYTSVVTKPTCTTGGYTTYTCSCGHSYKDNGTPAKGHTYGSWTQTKAPTCTVKGEEARTCATCGTKETRSVATIAHSYESTVIEATCTNGGYTLNTCTKCGYSVTNNKVSATGHNDGNADGVCDKCGNTMPEKDPSENCSCNCHKSGFMGFIWKIVLFFSRIFGANKTCGCGIKHY